MAVQYWKDMSILLGSIEMAGNAKVFDLTTDVQVLDTTSLASTGWVSVIGGNKSGKVNLDFMQDVVASGVDDTLWPLLGVAGTPKSICTNSADGSVAYLLQTIPLSYTPVSGAVGDLAMGNISGSSSNGPVVRGTLIHPSNVSRTSTSTGTGRQLGAVVAGKSMYAALHVVTVSGTNPTLAVIVQSDDNAGFTTPTSRITFSTATATTNRAQMSSVAGAITDDYWRISYTIGGTGSPTFAFAVTAGII
jgi:hypothetical protein